MTSLVHVQTKHILAREVVAASTFFSRTKGLMGLRDLPSSRCLWIVPCSGIHTFFMKFAIDVIFVNKQLKITAVIKNIAPWWLAYPPWFSKTHSVFEFKSPALKNFSLSVRDQLAVEKARFVSAPKRGA